MEDIKKPKRKYLLSSKEILLLSVVSISILLTPYLLSKPSLWFSLDDEGLARIGTAFSITAPFIGIFGSVLVYIAFKVQYRANEDINRQFQKQSNDEMFFRLFDSTKNRFNSTLTENAEKFVIKLDQNEAEYAKMMLLEDPTILDKIDLNLLYAEICETELVSCKEEMEELLRSENAQDKEAIIYLIPHQFLRYLFLDYFYKSSRKFKTMLYSQIYKDIKNNDHNVDSYFLNLINLVNFVVKHKNENFYKDFFISNLTYFEIRVIMQFCLTHFSNEALKAKLKELNLFYMMAFHSELFYGEPDMDVIRNEIEFAYHRGY